MESDKCTFALTTIYIKLDLRKLILENLHHFFFERKKTNLTVYEKL
jgi:hypothetical protein